MADDFNQPNTNYEHIINHLMDTPEDESKYKILHNLAGKIDVDEKETMYVVIFSLKQGIYHPLIVLDNNEILPIYNRFSELLTQIQDYEHGQELGIPAPEPEYGNRSGIPDYEKYYYFTYKGVLYKFSFPVIWDFKHNINTLNNKAIHYVMNDKAFTKNLYDDSLNQIKLYYHHNFEFEYDVMVSQVVLSYIYPLIGRVFYMPFLGGQGSGKSVALRVLSYLCKNGKFGGKGTVPSSVRMIELYGISLCQDEFEKMGQDEKIIFTGVMNSGFDEGAPYQITNMGNKDITKQVVSFKTFCPKMFTCNSLYGFDISFIDRCYIIHSVKAGISTKDIHQLSRHDLEIFQELRNKMFVYCLRNWREILADINNSKTELEKVGTFGRASDMMSIILGIITHFKGKDYADQVKQGINEKAPMELLEKTMTIEEAILSYIVDKFSKAHSTMVKIENDTLRLKICTDLGIDHESKEAPTHRRLRTLVTNLGLIPKKENLGFNAPGRRVYNINITDVLNAVKREGYTKLEEKLKVYNLTPSIPSTPSTLSDFTEDTEDTKETEDNVMDRHILKSSQSDEHFSFNFHGKPITYAQAIRFTEGEYKSLNEDEKMKLDNEIRKEVSRRRDKYEEEKLVKKKDNIDWTV